MDSGTNQAIWSAVRSILVTAGGIIAAKGYTDTATVNEIIGALMVLIPAIYGVWQKYQSERLTKDREATAVQAGVAAKGAGAIITPTEVVSTEHAQEIIKAFGPTPTEKVP